MDPNIGDLLDADILVVGDKIEAVGHDLAVDNAVEVDCSGHVVIPGFVNSHHHTFQAPLRGYWADALSEDYFTQSRQGEKAFFHCFEPDDVYIGQYAGALEQLRAGITTFVDTSQCTETPEHTHAAVEGLKNAGARTVYAYSARAHGSPPPETYAFPHDIGDLRDQYFPGSDQLVTLALGTRVDRDLWRLAKAQDLDVYSHTNDEATGLLVEQLADEGLLDPRTTLIHCTGLAESTWRRIAEAGAAVSLSNFVEQTLCTGAPGLQPALTHGLRPSLSTDAVSLGPVDMFSQMRATYALQRSRLQESEIAGVDHGSSYLNTRDILELATIEGARAAHLDHLIGSITPGKQADLVLLDGRELNAAPINHAAGAIVMLMDTSNVASVYVAGRQVKAYGRLVDVDERQVVARLEKTIDGLLSRADSPNILLTTCRS
jgi:cytosine/adenosine deaminase-related metal-dependent hydrolase